jgi:hypothetical protein
LEIGDSGRQKCRFCSDEIGREERERNRHIDLTRTAFFYTRSVRRQSPSPTRSRQASDSLGQSH